MSSKTYVVIGAGVIGLTTALELKYRFPVAKVIVLAKELPGDSSPTYSSAWAGANWISSATDNGCQEDWDRTTYLKFKELSQTHPECGIEEMDLISFYDEPIEKVNILSDRTGKIWYADLVGGIKQIPTQELPEGANFGFQISTFIINTQKYLPWLQIELAKLGVEIRRSMVDHIKDVKERFPNVSAVFNCTGLGAYSLGGVEDQDVYPAKGQIYLVESPSESISKMYFRSSERLGSSNTHIFPRGKDGGIILGGCRFNGDWSGDFDSKVGEEIKTRCCALLPELGKPEDLRILRKGVGLRPSRKGGARIEKEHNHGLTIIHNYGASGAGYQASWGLAKAAIDLAMSSAKL